MTKTLNRRLQTAAEALTVSAVDVAAIVGVFLLSSIIRTSILPYVYPGFPGLLPFRTINILWIFLVWIFFLYYEGLYTKRFSFWDEIKALWKVSFLSTVGVFAIVFIGKLGGEISRTVIILMGVVAMLVLPLVRTASKKVLKAMGLLKRKVLILGAGETGRLIARALRKEPNYGYEVIGFLDDDPEKLGKIIDGIKVHRGIDSAVRYLKRCNITDIFIAMPGAGKERLQRLINSLQHKVDRILFVPDMYGIAVIGTSLQYFFQEQAFALEMKNNLSRPLNVFIKRCFDLLMICILMPILSIPMLVIAGLIRFNSKGPAIFAQERIGRNGRIFMCFKFRTMFEDAEERLTELLKNDLAARGEWQKYWKLKNDTRVTKVGRFLRKTSMDELPQIFNVLTGRMSLVGPRPYLPKEWDSLKDYGETILSVRPGMTGLWQVSGRSNSYYEQRLSLDSWYVRNWNLWLDVVILLRTVHVLLKKEGAY